MILLRSWSGVRIPLRVLGCYNNRFENTYKENKQMPNLSVAVAAASLSSTNSAASDLLLNLDAAETSAQVNEALEAYDSAVASSN